MEKLIQLSLHTVLYFTVLCTEYNFVRRTQHKILFCGDPMNFFPISLVPFSSFSFALETKSSACLIEG